MIIFSEDTNVAWSFPSRIASHFVSLLDTGKSSHMAYSILSLVGALSCKPTPAPRMLRSTVYIKDPPVSAT